VTLQPVSPELAQAVLPGGRIGPTNRLELLDSLSSLLLGSLSSPPLIKLADPPPPLEPQQLSGLQFRGITLLAQCNARVRRCPTLNSLRTAMIKGPWHHRHHSHEMERKTEYGWC
jgi:hypothetical protein